MTLAESPSSWHDPNAGMGTAVNRAVGLRRPRAVSGGRGAAMIGPVRHNPATVVVLAGQPGEQALAAIGRSLNVVLVRPEPAPAAGGGGGGGGGGEIEAAAGVLRRAGGISAAYVLVAADPLGAVAAAWQAMWQVSAEPQRGDEFELRVAETLAAWRAKRFELPDYYLVLAGDGAPGGADADRPGTSVTSGTPGVSGASGVSGVSGAFGVAGASGAGEGRADFYLGPLRAVRPNRVAVAAGATPAAQADALLSELGSLRHGPWWPPLDEVLRTARGFYPGSLAESPTAGQARLLG
jgi:hypothetical protein